jgi:hypothetical protein
MITLWKTGTCQIGKEGYFKSEYEMETFLMLNPEVVGCGSDGEERPKLWQQTHIEKKYKENGRIDLIGIANKEGGEDEAPEKVLRIFELKNGLINKAAIEQLVDYIKAIGGVESKDKIASIIKESISGEGKDDINKLIDKPEGVLLGTAFDYNSENIKLIEDNGLKAIKIMKLEGDGDKYILIEDIVGGVVGRNMVKQFSWDDLSGKSENELEKEAPGYGGRIKKVKKFIDEGQFEEIKKIAKDCGMEISPCVTSGPHFFMQYRNKNICRVSPAKRDVYTCHIYCKKAPIGFKGFMGFNRDKETDNQAYIEVSYDEKNIREKIDNIKIAVEQAVEWFKDEKQEGSI